MTNRGRVSQVGVAVTTVALLLVAGCFVNPSLTQLTVSPLTPTITACPAPSGSSCTVQMSAIGTYSDGSTSSVSASWSTSDDTVATVSSTGLVSGVAAGTATITAQSSTVSGSTSVTVTLSNLQTIALSPGGSVSYALGTGSVQFCATGTFSSGPSEDITNAVTWISSDTTTATVSNSGSTSVPCAAGGAGSGGKGSVTFVKAGGPINITAVSGTTTSPATSLTITP